MSTFPNPCLVLFHVVLLSLLPLKINCSAKSQAEALVQWKNSFAFSPPSLNSWSLSNLNNLCNWTSITCNGSTGMVSEISLSHANMSGSIAEFNFTPFANYLTRFVLTNDSLNGPIPSSIGTLSKLIFLDLSDNRFRGEIPMAIYGLSELQHLNLYNNNLSGMIRPQLSDLQKLRYLDLGFNYLDSSDGSAFVVMEPMPLLTHLSLSFGEIKSAFPLFIFKCHNLISLDLSLSKYFGPIPESLYTSLYTNLTKLEYLNFTNNDFHGPLSSSISKLSKLIELKLGANELNGSIPDSIGTLSELEKLSLFNNQFEGKIPSSLGQLRKLNKLDLHMNKLNSTIPSELSSCTNLTYLDLGWNQLSGHLPMSFSKLTKLTLLDLSNSSLTGEIHPYFISNWTKLTTLNLQSNFFTGRIPPEIGLLTQLTHLILNNNQLFGPIPAEIGNLKSLVSLDLSGNKLSGSIPPSIWSLSNLGNLLLSNNNLSGTIPPEVGNMTSLMYFYLNTNAFHGELPDTISSLSNLTEFSVFSNNFSGEIPRDFGKNSPQLGSVNFSNNSFSGELPPELCSGFSLIDFSVSENKFTGSLPACLRNCTNLNRVRLEGNQFTGNITNAFGAYPYLYFIALSDNQFTGEISPLWGESQSLTNLQMDRNRISGIIPSELGKLRELRVLNLGANELTGEIPKELTNLSSLFKLNLSQNHLAGDIPQAVVNLVSLEYLDLSGNKLTGEIPKQVGNYEKLLSLNLSGNNLSGEIPQDLGMLMSLDNMNISHNKLSGRIPTSLSSMTNLGSFDFSYNELTGPIPSGGPFQNASGNAFAGNSGLCGDTGRLNPCTSSNTKSNRKLLIAIIVPVCGILILAIIAAGYFTYLRKTDYIRHCLTGEHEMEDLELPILDFATITKATNNFSSTNKLGQGGFGPVYKGTLIDGQDIAVKRLSKNSRQGLEEFKTEVTLIASLQHRNLVKLLGCCIWTDEPMLIYEYMSNKSLDYFIFDETRSKLLGWNSRMHIVDGIARGLLYLHHDSRLRIIHRDLKTSNILLDNNMNPKISDFGLARMFRGDQTQADTKRVVGTFGYISPEYAADGLFSTKSDVFSFGVLVLEIATGKRNRGFSNPEHDHNLLGHAWRLWMEERSLELVDNAMGDDYNEEEVLRCINVALLCVQQHPEDRPSMSSVLLMLCGESTLPKPNQPGFFIGRNLSVSDSIISVKNESPSINACSITSLLPR